MFQLFIFCICQILLYLIIKKIDREDNELINIYKLQKYPCISVILIIIFMILIALANNIYYTIILSIFLLGCIQDIQTQYVCDIFQYLTLCITFIHFLLCDINTLHFLYIFPFIFIVITWTMRGTADSIAMIIWTLFYIPIFEDIIYILYGFLFAYFLQIIVQIIYCVVKHCSWRQKQYMAFFPALTLGMSVIYFLK